jgi:DNA-directed DNA polymerase III PolC
MIRSGYSFRTAFGHLPDVLSRVIECGYKVAPLADRCSTFGFVRWTKLCKKSNIRPVYGVELAVTGAFGTKKPVVDHWTFLAVNGLKGIHSLVALATANPDRDPSLSYDQALAAEDVIIITGEKAQLDNFPPAPNLYVALSPATPKGFYRAAKAAGHKFIARSDNLYPRPEDKEIYRIALGRRSTTQTYPQYILTKDEWFEALKWTADSADIAEAWENKIAALDSCKAELHRAELLKPERPDTLRNLCLAGAKKLKVNLKNKIYSERLNRELKLISEKNFEDYFYIIADMIAWAKQHMIVGPARGSSCGSLVCYLLGITTIDPIPFGLIFERFIDINRKDLPDIDIDFSDARRDLVFKYVEKKYGRDRVARLGTVGLFKPRSALNQAGISLQIPRWLVERTLDGVIERSGGDSRAMLALEDTLNGTEMGRKLLDEYPEARLAGKMEGHPNNASQHAAGIVLTEHPLSEYVAIDSRTNSAMCDKKDAEDLNLLKIDALGLTQLSVFERTLELIGKPARSGFLETLPLDDVKAFDVLNSGHFSGIFQFTGTALMSLTRQVKITNIDDIISITALARPGPMATGGANSWVKRRSGREKVTTQHPMLTELTKETYGIVVYQETVMNIARGIGQLSWEDTSELRKAMSKSLGDEFFNAYWIKFRTGALANGLEEKTAREIWDQVNTFGSWAFNKAHAVAYGIVSYWCCWLKAHHPVEFAAATLDAEADPAKQIKMLRELESEGVKYKPVDPDHSTDRWSFKTEGDERILIGPITSIKGIGPASMREILDARKNGEPLRASLAKKLANCKTEIDTLYPIRDRIKQLHPDLSAIKIVTKQTDVIDVRDGEEKEVMILGVATKIAPVDENENIRVMRRGKEVSGPSASLNLFFADDTDEVFCKVNRFKFESIGRAIVDRGRPGKSLYAIKGRTVRTFRMIDVQQVRYLGDLE